MLSDLSRDSDLDWPSAPPHGEIVAGISASELLDLLPVPCLFTDREGRCIDANAAFHRKLERLSLHVALGRVRFRDPRVQRQWEAALYETHTTAVGGTMGFSAPDGAEWRIHLVARRPAGVSGEAVGSKLILVVFERSGPQAAIAQAEQAAQGLKTHLTDAEMDVLSSLMQGMPAKDIAARRRSSITTVRNQIMSILGKTGHRSQRTLIAAFATSVLPTLTQDKH